MTQNDTIEELAILTGCSLNFAADEFFHQADEMDRLEDEREARYQETAQHGIF